MPRLTGSSSSMISIARILGAPVSVPAGKVALQHVQAAHAVLQQAFDVADDVHHVRIALDDEGLGHLDAAGLGDAADVVARQVDQHQVFGAFLRVGRQLGFQRLVLLGRGATRARAGQRADRDLAAFGRVLLAHQDLGAGADDLEVAHVVEVHVGRGSASAARGTATAGFRCSASSGAGRSAPASCRRRRCTPCCAATAAGSRPCRTRAPPRSDGPRLTGGAVTL
jgi:hypothetical protein